MRVGRYTELCLDQNGLVVETAAGCVSSIGKEVPSCPYSVLAYLETSTCQDQIK